MSPRKTSSGNGPAPAVTAADSKNATEAPTPKRSRAPRVRVPGDVVRAVRCSLGYTRDDLLKPLRVGPASLARYELVDAPAWMRYALIGVGVLERGVPVDEMVRRFAAESAAAADRREPTKRPTRPRVKTVRRSSVKKPER